MKAINDGNGRLYFLDAPTGGTGKTILVSVILATVCAGSIAVVVASSFFW